jgi:hypothetical protein
LKNIEKNKNNLGGVDLGFDIAKRSFCGLYLNNNKTILLKNSVDKNDLTLLDLVVPLKIMFDK